MPPAKKTGKPKGYKAMTIRLSLEDWKKTRDLSEDTGKSIHTLFIEGLNLKFVKKYGSGAHQVTTYKESNE